MIGRLVLAGAATFAVGLLLSAVTFHDSRSFDWRALIISDLQSPEENPGGYYFSAGATAVTGLLLLPVVRAFHSRFRPVGGLVATAGSLAFSTGAFGAVLLGLLAPFPVSYDTVHVPLAFATFIGIVAGIAAYMSVLARHPSPGSSPPGGIVRACLALTTGTLGFLVYVYFIPDFFDGRSLLTTLALWEWSLCAAILGLLLLLAAAVDR